MNKIQPEPVTTCRRCGTCCTKGGPALHKSDLPLIHQLELGDLITIRLGEPVFSPLVDDIEPARNELIKLAGQQNSWTCHFFDQLKKNCRIYTHRPVECRLLKCWEPSPLTNIIYQDCLSRRDIVPADDEFDDKLWELIETQEEQCGFAKLDALCNEFARIGDTKIMDEITRTVNLDLSIRKRALKIRGLSLAEELLYFGRPLFKSLAFFHLAVKEDMHGLTVSPDP